MSHPSVLSPWSRTKCKLALAPALSLLFASANASPSGQHQGHLGVCMPIQAGSPSSLRNLDAAVAAGQVYELKGISVDDPVELSADIEAGRARVTEYPHHGKLSKDPAIGYGFLYTPNSGYLGMDRATFSVSIGRDFVDVTFHLEVVDGDSVEAGEYMKFFSKHCPREQWMESS